MSNERDPSTDQQLPVVTPKSVPVLARIKELLDERTELGIKKYGVPVLTNTGRVADRDALEEAIDLIQYQQQRVMERDDALSAKDAEVERLTAELAKLREQLRTDNTGEPCDDWRNEAIALRGKIARGEQ